MSKQTNWWEPIFSGNLEIGINKEKMENAEQESFLYYDETQFDMESQA